MKITLLVVLLIIASSFTLILTKPWKISSGYRIQFDGKYAHGNFNHLKGNIDFDPLNPAAGKFDVTVEVASIDTGIELKNKHAKSDKWFDAEKYPEIRFVSSSVASQDSGFVVRGELEMHGLKKEIAIPFHFKNENEQTYFSGKFKVNRGDFAIGKVNGKESDSTMVTVLVPVNAL